MNAPPLRVRQLHKALASRPVLRGVDLELRAGEWTGLIGPNGSGKSTLLRCLAGILRPDAGDIHVAGHALATQAAAAKHCLGYATEPELLPRELSGRQCLQLLSRARGLGPLPDESLQLAEALGLSPWIDEAVGRCSLGTRQKLAIILALLGRPPLVLLDEALNGLDPVSALALKEFLQTLTHQHGCAVLLATHGLDVAEHFLDRAVLMLDGRLVQDWDRADLEALRRTPGASLEQAVVERMRQPRGKD